MVIAISGALAVILLVCHRHFTNVKGSSDVQTGMASAMFWMVFAGAGWSASAGDITDIYFYLFFAGIGMTIIMLISSLNISPTQEEQQEKRTEQGATGMAGMRERLGWRKLRRKN